MRMSITGTMIPRRLTTPLMKSGVLAMRVTLSYRESPAPFEF
jgi:hypothetical protein